MPTITVFDPTYQRSKTITVEIVGSVVQEDETGELEFLVRFTTTAKTKAGNAIEKYHFQRLTDLVRVTTQHDGVTTTPYANLSAEIEDYLLEMIEGNGTPNSEMDFSS